MNYLVQRKINGYTFIDDICGSMKSAKACIKGLKEMGFGKGARYSIVPKKFVECPTCEAMVESLCSRGSCIVCNAIL